MMTPAERQLLKAIARMLTLAHARNLDQSVQHQRRVLTLAIDDLEAEETGGYSTSGGGQ